MGIFLNILEWKEIHHLIFEDNEKGERLCVCVCVCVSESVSDRARECVSVSETERYWIPEYTRKGQKWESLKIRAQEWPAEGANTSKAHLLFPESSGLYIQVLIASTKISALHT